jgi:protein-disulfide isomerase
MAEGTRLKIDSTPTFFVNGTKTEIKNDPGEFKKVLDSALAAKKS